MPSYSGQTLQQINRLGDVCGNHEHNSFLRRALIDNSVLHTGTFTPL